MSRNVPKLWRKLFYSPYFFTIALRRKTDESILDRSSFTAEYIFPATFRNWAADPILVDHGGMTYLFYEAVVGEKGRIEVVCVNQDCTVSSPTVILEDDCHYSYPFVFKIDDCWYMIPESSANEEVRLYKACSFPEKWEMVTVLLRQKSVDTTVFIDKGRLYLLTYEVSSGTEQVRPQAYRVEWNEKNPVLHPISWKNWDGLKSRGAGPIFVSEGKQIRPAQLNGMQEYGNGVLFYQISADEQEYKEILIGKLLGEQINASRVWMDGLHTYAVSEKFEAIDIRCRAFDAGKPLRILKNRLKQRQKK